MPDQSDQRAFKNDEMINYIQKKIEACNPDYAKDEQPSQVRNILLISLLALPFSLTFLYFSGIFG